MVAARGRHVAGVQARAQPVLQLQLLARARDGARQLRVRVRQPVGRARVARHDRGRAEHLTPVFVGSTNPQTGKHTPARASLVGVMPMGLQQLLHGLMGAARDETVVVQYEHNFGYLIYRASAAPDIMTSKNRERSSKAISCVNVDGDEPAFGTREEKVKMCKLHRAAWAANLDYVRPLCTRIAPPRSDERRARGDRAAVDYIKERKRDLDAVGVHMKQEHDAAALFHAAAVQQPRPPPRPPSAGAPAQSGGSR